MRFIIRRTHGWIFLFCCSLLTNTDCADLTVLYFKIVLIEWLLKCYLLFVFWLNMFLYYLMKTFSNYYYFRLCREGSSYREEAHRLYHPPVCVYFIDDHKSPFLLTAVFNAVTHFAISPNWVRTNYPMKLFEHVLSMSNLMLCQIKLLCDSESMTFKVGGFGCKSYGFGGR